jgi:hypothetical protein
VRGRDEEEMERKTKAGLVESFSSLASTQAQIKRIWNNVTQNAEDKQKIIGLHFLSFLCLGYPAKKRKKKRKQSDRKIIEMIFLVKKSTSSSWATSKQATKD